MGILIDQLFHSEKGISEEKYRCFFFDMGENIHFHYRDLRIELSVAEFKELIESIDRYKGDVLAEIANGYQDGVLPNTNEHHTVKTFWNRERLQHPIKYNPQRISIEENTDGFHIHLRNYKLLLDKSSFLELAEGMAQSLFALKNRSESDPLELLHINDLFPKLIIKTVTEDKEELQIGVQKKYYSKTRQVLNGLGYVITRSDKSKQIFEKAHKKIITFLDSGSNQITVPSEHKQSMGENQFIPLSRFVSELATSMDIKTINELKLKLLFLFKQAEKGYIKNFSIFDVYIDPINNNPSVNLFNNASIDMKAEYNKLLDLYTQHNIFMAKPDKERFNKNYIQYIADKFKKYIDETLAPLACVQKIYLFGSLNWEKAGNYQAPFVHYDWVKLASDFDIFIEIDEDYLDQIPKEWKKQFFYQPPSAYYYHLGDLGNSQSSPLSQAYPSVTFYQHLIEAYLFFPSKGDNKTKESFIQKYKGCLLYSKPSLNEQLKKGFGFSQISSQKFSAASHNYVYKVITPEKNYVFKVYNKATSLQVGMVKHEINLLNQLRSTGLELAYPVASLSGDYIGEFNGNESVLFDYIDGEFSKKISISQAQQAGNLLARFHKDSSHLELDMNEKYSQNSIYNLWIDNALGFVKRGQMTCYSEQELGDLKQILRGLNEVESFLHGDVAPKNFKFQADQCYLIDFEQLSYGLRIFDLIDGMIEFSIQKNQCNKQLAMAFFNAYKQVFSLSESQLSLFNDALQILILAKITRLYRTHLVFDYDLNTEQIQGLKDCFEILAI